MHTMKICTYNVGGWTDGTRTGLRPEELPDRLTGWAEFLSDFDPDLLLCEEAAEYADAARTMPAYETLFAGRYPFMARPAGADRLTAAILICSKSPVEDLTVRAFASGSSRPFVTFTTQSGGRRLTVAVVHLSIEANAGGLRQKDLAELADLLEKGALDIVTGDFNTYEIREFDIFRSCAELANHGTFGDFETWPHTAGQWNRCIDNIIIRKGLSVSRVRLGTRVLSDHMPLMADLI